MRTCDPCFDMMSGAGGEVADGEEAVDAFLGSHGGFVSGAACLATFQASAVDSLACGIGGMASRFSPPCLRLPISRMPA